jgi:L-fuculose-phosphate aldolase
VQSNQCKDEIMDSENALRPEVVETCRAMNALGINKGTSGNISARVEGGFLISPTGTPYDQLTPDMVVRVGMDGCYTGTIKPSSEWQLHRDVYLSNPSHQAIVHTHSTYATALAILGKAIPAIHYTIAAAGGSDIRCARYATFGSEDLARNVVEAMQGRRACLMEHHGVLAAHRSLQRALSLASLVELLAQQYMICRAVQEPPVLGDDEIARVLEKYKTYGQQPAAAQIASA